MADDTLDPDILEAIQNQNKNPATFGDQMKGLWGAMTAPIGAPTLSPGQVPFSSKFPSTDAWQAYNNAVASRTNLPDVSGAGLGVNVADATSQPDSTGAAQGLQAGMDASQMPQALAQTPWQGKPLQGRTASLNPVSGGAIDPKVQQAIAQKYGFGQGLDSDAIKAAQQKARTDTLNANLGEAGNDIGAAFAQGTGSKYQADNKFYQNLRDQAQQPLQNIAALRQAKLQDIGAASTMAENDPNSPLSQNLRQVYAKLGVPQSALEGASAADMKGFLQNPAETMAKLQAQRDNKLLGLAQIKSNKDLALSNRQADKLAGAYKDTMNDDVVKGAKGELSQASTVLGLTNDATTNPQSANALKIYAARYSTGNKRINETEISNMGEGAKDVLDRLNQVASTSSQGTLTPQNAAFMRKFIQVTQGTAAKNYQDAVRDRADSYAKLYGVDKDDLADKFGVNSRVVGSKNQNQVAGGADPQISSWAQTHNLPYEQAAGILKSRGYQGAS